jgi:hypothetical protein
VPDKSRWPKRETVSKVSNTLWEFHAQILSGYELAPGIDEKYLTTKV